MSCGVCGRELAGVVVMFTRAEDKHENVATCGRSSCLLVGMRRAGRDAPAVAEGHRLPS